MTTEFEKLAQLLNSRLEVIADHALRDSDPDAHLEALKSVSLEIDEAHQSLKAQGQVPPMLNHFLSNCSFDKALAFIEGDTAGH